LATIYLVAAPAFLVNYTIGPSPITLLYNLLVIQHVSVIGYMTTCVVMPALVLYSSVTVWPEPFEILSGQLRASQPELAFQL
jgi:hypothetical protein